MFFLRVIYSTIYLFITSWTTVNDMYITHITQKNMYVDAAGNVVQVPSSTCPALIGDHYTPTANTSQRVSIVKTKTVVGGKRCQTCFHEYVAGNRCPLDFCRSFLSHPVISPGDK